MYNISQMSNKMTFAQQVREKYGDTKAEFAFRLGVTEKTITNWERGDVPPSTGVAILEYAYKYGYEMKSGIGESFANLTLNEQLQYLMDLFNCNLDGLAVRMRIDKFTLRGWITRNSVTTANQRYIYEVALHPERFRLF